ncbi:ATP-binding protein, partial [Corynebacterium nasicanis]
MYSSHNLGSQQTSGKILRTVVDDATDLEPGGGLLFLITGPVGSGKSSLVREIARSLPGWSGIRVSALSWHADEEGELLTHILHRADGTGTLGELVDREGARTAIIIDDAHWADVTSLRALVEATRRLREGRVVVILTASDKDDADDDLPMSRMREMADHAITLAPLDVEDVAALALSSIGAHLSPLAAAELRDLTGGRP